MRKALAVLLVLLVLLGIGFGTAHCLVNDTKDQVSWEETILLGDRSTVEGLTVTARNRHQNYLLWETTGTLGGELAPETEFTFSNERIRWDSEYRFDGITIDPATSVSDLRQNDSEITQLAKDNFPELLEYIRECDASVEIGTEEFFTVDMTQYADYYPLEAWFDIENCPWDRWSYFDGFWSQDTPDSVMEELNNYFRIPIVGEYTIEFSVNRIAENSTSMGSSATMTYSPSFLGATTKDATYFTFNPVMEDGNIADVSLIPDGYGIYMLNYSYDEEGVFQRGDPLVEMVYSLDPSLPYAGLKISDDEKYLYLHRWLGDDYTRTVIDLATMTEVQQFTLVREREDAYFQVHNYDDFLVVIQHGEALPTTLTVFEEEAGGTFTHQFTVPINTEAFSPSDQMDIWGYEDYHMDYDGKRLAIAQNAFCLRGEYYEEDVCDFHVVVYEETGMTFAARYDVNLTDINVESEEYESPCEIFYECPIEVFW